MKIKRIFAIIAVVLLVALYGSTIVFAMSDSPNAVYMFKASIFCTVIIPIILYSYILVYRIFGKRNLIILMMQRISQKITFVNKFYISFIAKT